jgi:hypothetical protein
MIVGTTFTWFLMPSLLRLGEQRASEASRTEATRPLSEGAT